MSTAPIIAITLLILAALQIAAYIIRRKRLAKKEVALEHITGLVNDLHYLEAEEFTEALPPADLKDADILYNLGYIKYNLNKIDKALNCFESSVKLNRRSAQSHYSLGHILFHNKEELKSAEFHLKKAIALNKGYARAKSTLGVLYYTMGQYKKAEKLLFSAVTEEEQAPKAYNTLGLISFKRKEFGSAVSHFRQSILLDDKDTEVLVNLANVHAMQMEYKDAEAVFLKAEALKPSDKFIKYWLGSTLYLAKEYNKAGVKLTEAIKLDPEFAQGYLQRAFVYKKLGNREEYLKDYGKAITLNPKLKIN